MAPRNAAPKALVASKKNAPATRADDDGTRGDNREIHLGIDYGSVNVSAAWYIYTPGLAIEGT